MKALRFTDKQIPCSLCDRCGHLWLSGPIADKYENLVFNPYSWRREVQSGLYYLEYARWDTIRYAGGGGEYRARDPWENKSKLCQMCITFLNGKYQCKKERFYAGIGPECHDCSPHKYRNPRFFCEAHNKGQSLELCVDCGKNRVSQYYDISCQACKGVHLLAFFSRFMSNSLPSVKKEEKEEKKEEKKEDVGTRFKALRHHQKRIIHQHFQAFEEAIAEHVPDDLAGMVVSFL